MGALISKEGDQRALDIKSALMKPIENMSCDDSCVPLTPAAVERNQGYDRVTTEESPKAIAFVNEAAAKNAPIKNRTKLKAKKCREIAALLDDVVVKKTTSKKERGVKGRKRAKIEDKAKGEAGDGCGSCGSSIAADHGDLRNSDPEDNVPWKGCICGIVHPRPTPVFWIQCDGYACGHAWYNVSEQCVDKATCTTNNWYCPACSKTSSNLRIFLELPDVILYKILCYIAVPYERCTVLLQDIAPLCHEANEIIRSPRFAPLWSLMYQQEYKQITTNKSSTRNTPPRTITTRNRRNKRNRNEAFVCTSALWDSVMDEGSGLRSLKRRLCFLSTKMTPEMEQVHLAHWRQMECTNDAHFAVISLTDCRETPLTLHRLRNILKENGKFASLHINHRSPTQGRTFLMEICTADYVDEKVILHCIQELVGPKWNANVNIFSTDEFPDAEKSVLFFAVARVMPSVIDYLLKNGADARIASSGRFRLVSDPEIFFRGTYTPLTFAQQLFETEMARKRDFETNDKNGQEPKKKVLPQYYLNKMIACIEILKKWNRP